MEYFARLFFERDFYTTGSTKCLAWNRRDQSEIFFFFLRCQQLRFFKLKFEADFAKFYNASTIVVWFTRQTVISTPCSLVFVRTLRSKIAHGNRPPEKCVLARLSARAVLQTSSTRRSLTAGFRSRRFYSTSQSAHTCAHVRISMYLNIFYINSCNICFYTLYDSLLKLYERLKLKEGT